jgi:hypothetical protein
MLTAAQILELQLPFELNEHGFKPRKENDPGGDPFILRTALERRLNRVAPGWSFSDPQLVHVLNNAVIMRATLILEGQSHSEIGTGIIRKPKVNKETGEINEFDLAQNTANAFKQAASQCLPRCAFHFGVGWYLKDVPAGFKERIRTRDGLREYLLAVKDAMERAQGRMEVAKAVLGNGDQRRIS